MERALLTDGERERISGEYDDDNQRYVAVSRVRSRVNARLAEDLRVLKEHNEDLFNEIVESVSEVDRDVFAGFGAWEGTGQAETAREFMQKSREQSRELHRDGRE